MITALPIAELQDDVLGAWRTHGGCIVSAPPGSGKTTTLPLWLLAQGSERIYLLIPKRLAVHLAAEQLARNLDEAVGQRVGVRLRNETRQSAHTQLIVTTYGSFLRALLNDPDEISGATVIFDEFHERSLDQDLCYALLNQYVETLDDSVRRIIMSATLNVARIIEQTALPLLESDGFSYPVTVSYQKTDVTRADTLARLLEHQWQQSDDHCLVFLPGLREIRAVERALKPGIPLIILHGQLDTTPDLNALSNAPAQLILATNVAESSITLARVHTVIDTGLERYASSDPITGINQLKTRRISQASARQRAGRAGRLGPGRALRLWSQDEQHTLVEHQPAEIIGAELSQLVLQCAQWGSNGQDLNWLDAPGEKRWQLATEQLRQWRALDERGQLTHHGQQMARTGLEPWLAHLLSCAQNDDCLAGAIWLAAHLMQAAPLSAELLQQRDSRFFTREVRREAHTLARQLNTTLSEQFSPIAQATLVRALSHRLIYWRDATTGQLISGTQVRDQNREHRSEWSVLLNGIRQGRDIQCSDLLDVASEAVQTQVPAVDSVRFDPEQKPHFRRERRVGQILLSSQAHSPSTEEKLSAWCDYIERFGEQALPWSTACEDLKRRWQFAAALDADWPRWPRQWTSLCRPFLAGLKQLTALNLLDVLNHALGYDRAQQLNQIYPVSWRAPSQRSVTLHYDVEHCRVSAELKLQETFGLATQPTLGCGLPIQLQLLAPNGRPVAMVTDLPYFWQHTYPEIRKELRGRYNKHPWPEDPLSALATQQTNRQLRQHSPD